MRACAFIFLVILINSAQGYALEREKELLEKNGWFWYEINPEETPIKEMTPLPDEKNIWIPNLSDYTEKKLWEMHPDRFNPLMKAFHKKAVQNPTIENVRDYKIVEDIARRKASAVSSVTMMVVQQYPELSVQKDYPSTKVGRTAFVSQKNADIENTLGSAKENFGLLYFYSPDCPYCTQQNTILRRFLVKYGWEITGVNIDTQVQIKEQFNVSTVPHIEVVKRGNANSMPVATGVVSLSEMEQRLYRAIRFLNGETSPQNWNTYGFQKGGAFDTDHFLESSAFPEKISRGNK